MGNVCPMAGNGERRRSSQDSEPPYRTFLEADDIGNLFVSPSVADNASRAFKVANSSGIAIVSCVGEPGSGKTKTINDLLELTGNSFRFPVHRDTGGKNLVLATNGPMLKLPDGVPVFALDVFCDKSKRRAYLACVNGVLHITSCLLIAVDQKLLEKLPSKLQHIGHGFKREMACIIFRNWRVKKHNGEYFEPRVINIDDFLRISDKKDPLNCVVLKFVESIRKFFKTCYVCFPANDSAPWVTRSDLMVLEQHFRRPLVIGGEVINAKNLVESVRKFDEAFHGSATRISRKGGLEGKIQEDVAKMYLTLFTNRANESQSRSILSQEQVRIVHEEISNKCTGAILEKYPSLDRPTRDNLLPQLIHREYELQCEKASAAEAGYTESTRVFEAYFEDVISVFTKYLKNSEYNFSVDEILAACLSEDISNQLEVCNMNKECKNVMGNAATSFTIDLRTTQALFCEFKRRVAELEDANEYEIIEAKNVWNMKAVTHRLGCEITRDKLRSFLKDSISSEFQRIIDLKLNYRDVEELSVIGGAKTGARTLVYADSRGQLTISGYFDEDSRKQLGVHTKTLVGFLSVIGVPGSGKTTIMNDLMQLTNNDRMFPPEPPPEHQRQVLVASRYVFPIDDMQEPIAIYPLDICCGRGIENVYNSLSEFCLHLSSCVVATVDEASVDSFPRNLVEINGGEKREMICILFWNWDAYKITKELFDCNVISAREFLSAADRTNAKTARAAQFVEDLKPYFEFTYVCFPIRDSEGPELASWLVDDSGFKQLLEHFSKALVMSNARVHLMDMKNIVENFNLDRNERQVGIRNICSTRSSPTSLRSHLSSPTHHMSSIIGTELANEFLAMYKAAYEDRISVVVNPKNLPSARLEEIHKEVMQACEKRIILKYPKLSKYNREKELATIISGRFEEEEFNAQDDDYMRQILTSYHSEHFKEVEELFAFGIKNGSEEITIQELVANSAPIILKETMATASKDVQEFFTFIGCQFRTDLETIRDVLSRCRRDLTLVNSAEAEQIQNIRMIFNTRANNTKITCEMEKDRLRELLNELVEAEIWKFQRETEDKMSNSQEALRVKAQRTRILRTMTEIGKQRIVDTRPDLAQRSISVDQRPGSSNSLPRTHGGWQALSMNLLRARPKLMHQPAVFETYPVRDSPRASVDIHAEDEDARGSSDLEGEGPHSQTSLANNHPEIHQHTSNMEHSRQEHTDPIADLVAHVLKMYHSFMNKAMDKSYFTNRKFRNLHNEISDVISYSLGHILVDFNKDLKDIIQKVDLAIQIAFDEFSQKNQARISVEVRRESVVTDCMEIFQTQLQSLNTEHGGGPWRTCDIEAAKGKAQDYLEALTSDENDVVWKQWSEDLENNIQFYVMESTDPHLNTVEPRSSPASTNSSSAPPDLEAGTSIKDELGELAVLIAEKLRQHRANTTLKRDAREALKKALILLHKEGVPLHQLKISLESLKIFKETLGL